MSITIGVKFKNNDKVYAFKCYDAIKIGDIVVVDTRFGVNIAEVVEIEPKTINVPLGELREVISVVDFTVFNERKEKAKKFETLKAKMDEKVAQLQTIAIYELLAEKDPDLKGMLEEFKSLI